MAKDYLEGNFQRALELFKKSEKEDFTPDKKARLEHALKLNPEVKAERLRVPIKVRRQLHGTGHALEDYNFLCLKENYVSAIFSILMTIGFFEFGKKLSQSESSLISCFSLPSFALSIYYFFESINSTEQIFSNTIRSMKVYRRLDKTGTYYDLNEDEERLARYIHRE